MQHTTFTPYFWQNPKWADFWKTANGQNHKVFELNIEYSGIKVSAFIYQYPWFLGQHYFYLPEGPIIHDLYFNRYTDSDSLRNYPLNKEQEDELLRKRIRSSLQIFFQNLITLAGKEKAAFIKFDPDDALVNIFNLKSRQETKQFLDSLLGLSLITGQSNKLGQPTLIQSIPKQAGNLKLNGNTKILDASRIVLSSKRIMYWACMVINLHVFESQPISQIPQAETTSSNHPFHNDNLTRFFEQNKIFWSNTSSQTKTKTRKSLAQNWQISAAKTEQNFEAFWEVYNQTAQRQSFTTHDRNYFHEFFKRDFSRILIARDENNMAHAVWLGLAQSDSLIYMYGGNTQIGLQKFGPHIIQLAALNMATIEKKLWYDLGGYEEGTGFGFFKEGYKGQLRLFPGGIDLILNPVKVKSINLGIQMMKKFK